MNFLNLLIVTALFTFAVSCKVQKKENDNSKSSNMIESIENTTDIQGQIVKVTFVNKGGREFPDIYDLFIKTDDDMLFIRLSDSKVSNDALEKYLDKDVKLRIIKRNGLWDTDDPNVQSRVGDYAEVLEILD